MADTGFASHIRLLLEVALGDGFTIELEHSLDWKGLPTAKCTEHGLVLRPEPVSTHATLTVTWSCPICTAEESMSLKDLWKRSQASDPVS